jgi:Holliday junction resolvasome RuvABC endonuclease subunit
MGRPARRPARGRRRRAAPPPPELPPGHRLLALDTSSTCIGWAYFEGGELRDFGKLPLSSRGALGLVEFEDWLVAQLAEFDPHDVAVEWPFPGRNPKTYGILMQVVTVVQLQHVRYYGREIPKPNQVEAHAVKRLLKRPKGTNPDNTKRMMVEYINSRLGLSLKYKDNDKTKRVSDDDIADAIAVGLAWFTRQERG